MTKSVSRNGHSLPSYAFPLSSDDSRWNSSWLLSEKASKMLSDTVTTQYSLDVFSEQNMYQKCPWNKYWSPLTRLPLSTTVELKFFYIDKKTTLWRMRMRKQHCCRMDGTNFSKNNASLYLDNIRKKLIFYREETATLSSKESLAVAHFSRDVKNGTPEHRNHPVFHALCAAPKMVMGGRCTIFKIYQYGSQSLYLQSKADLPKTIN